MTKLTVKQKAFVNEYLIDLNATQAAIRAGYSVKTAKVIGHENMTKPYIAEAIRQNLEKRTENTEITTERVLEEYGRIAFLDMRQAFNEEGKLLPIHEMPEDVARALAGLDYTSIGNGDDQIGLTTKIKLIDKKGALDSLSKYLNIFSDKPGGTTNNIQNNISNINFIPVNVNHK